MLPLGLVFCQRGVGGAPRQKEEAEVSTHNFTLIVEGADLQDEAVIDRLFNAGCDDAVVSSMDGVQRIDFDRDAASLDAAVLSAVADVERVGGVRVVHLVGAGLVELSS